ncbi:MAG: DUF1573 domain-containing protein [Candidatus Hydrothermarchaeaceae archaeon]
MSKFLLLVLVAMLAGITAGCVSDNEEPVIPQEENVTAPPAATPEPVSPDEIYKMFMCPCCGNPIDSNCCGTSVERQNYANALIDAGLSKEEIVMRMVLRYGVTSLINESDKDEVRAELIKRAPKNRPQIVVEPVVVDLGNVSFTEGEVYTVLSIQNVGMDDLVINGMDSSCGCTTAALVVDGVEGPRFSMAMHGTNPVGWSHELSHGQPAQLKIYYNTTFHPDFRGPAIRIITIFSNDPIDFAKEVRVELNQVD